GLRLDAAHDAVAGVNYRFTVSPLLGYYFIKATNTSLVTEVGPGYLYQRQQGQSATSDATLRLAERFEYKFSPTAKMWQSVQVVPHTDDFSNYYLTGEV